jgi:gas vesicle protein
MATPSKKQSSHLGAGLAAGAIIGLATGLFMQSRKGKELTKDAQKKAMELQKQVMKKLKEGQDMTKEKYEEVVDYVLNYYTKSRQLAKKEVPEARKFLMGRWKGIESELKKGKGK